MSVSITLNVNGVPYPIALEPHRTLVNVIRNEVGLTGTKEGCDDCECGACMVLVDGRPVNSCSYLAVQADGREVTTVEGLGTVAEPHPLQRHIVAEGGVQCGFCTPGMLMSAEALLRGAGGAALSETAIREGLAGNLCRCTGYAGIVAAVLSESERRATEGA
jgi:carbon-monoxide dehydrogenase small subunit